MMAQRSRSSYRSENAGGLLALLPLVLVFGSIAFLAVGTNSAPDAAKPGRAALHAENASGNDDDAANAAAAAVVAISLARVAPALPEEALKPPKPAPAQKAAEAERKPAVRRETAQSGPQQRPQSQVTRQTVQAVEPPAPPEPLIKPKEEGVIARIAAYTPSPARIAGAINDGVSKLASFIPGL
jgi:hypothetical protein